MSEPVIDVLDAAIGDRIAFFREKQLAVARNDRRSHGRAARGTRIFGDAGKR